MVGRNPILGRENPVAERLHTVADRAGLGFDFLEALAEGVEFDLLLVSRSRTDPNGTNNTSLRGSWRNEAKTPPELPDDLALQGWSLHAIGSAAKDVNRQQGIVYDAIPRQGFATLGELRKAIVLGWPGQPDAVYHGKK